MAKKKPVMNHNLRDFFVRMFSYTRCTGLTRDSPDKGIDIKCERVCTRKKPFAKDLQVASSLKRTLKRNLTNINDETVSLSNDCPRLSLNRSQNIKQRKIEDSNGAGTKVRRWNHSTTRVTDVLVVGPDGR